MERRNKTSPVKFLCRVQAPDVGREEILRTFRSLVGPIRGAAGCRSCELLEDVQRPGQLRFCEEWATSADFAQHVQSDLFQRVLVGLELAAEPPDVEIETISGRRGMDLIFELRGEKRNSDSPVTKESRGDREN